MNKNSISRRGFIGAAAASTLAIPLAGIGQNTLARAAEEKPVRLGFVGVGSRGSGFLLDAFAVGGVQVLAICDINGDTDTE